MLFERTGPRTKVGESKPAKPSGISSCELVQMSNIFPGKEAPFRSLVVGLSFPSKQLRKSLLISSQQKNPIKSAPAGTRWICRRTILISLEFSFSFQDVGKADSSFVLWLNAQSGEYYSDKFGEFYGEQCEAGKKWLWQRTRRRERLWSRWSWIAIVMTTRVKFNRAFFALRLWIWYLMQRWVRRCKRPPQRRPHDAEVQSGWSGRAAGNDRWAAGPRRILSRVPRERVSNCNDLLIEWVSSYFTLNDFEDNLTVNYKNELVLFNNESDNGLFLLQCFAQKMFNQNYF